MWIYPAESEPRARKVCGALAPWVEGGLQEGQILHSRAGCLLAVHCPACPTGTWLQPRSSVMLCLFRCLADAAGSEEVQVCPA